MHFLLQSVVAATLFLPPVYSTAGTEAAAHPTQASIRTAIKAQFDRPSAPVQVNPISVVKDYAVAGWTQEKQGGRALLRQEKGKWVVVACGGDGMAKADTLKLAGMSHADAVALEKAVDKAEATVPATRRKMFALFNGVVKMDGAHGHAAHAAHGTAAPGKAAHTH